VDLMGALSRRARLCERLCVCVRVVSMCVCQCEDGCVLPEVCQETAPWMG
jgi:hypothetical protein